MNTQIWNEPYVRENPFLYISPRHKDFEGENGHKMQTKFKQIFIKAYTKYKSITDKVVPQEVYLAKAEQRRQMEMVDRN